MQNRRHRFLFAIKRLVPILLIFLVGSSLVYDRSLATPKLSLTNLPEISLDGVKSLLIVAPHPDDETLGPGGLIQAALAKGIQVYVIVVTNGDGQEIAPAALGMGVVPKTADFVKIGEQRQAESLKALQSLGLPAENAFYLSYPDRGTFPMWQADWNTDCPYYSTYTKSTQSPYPKTYNPNATYCGWDVLKDLRSIIEDHKPDLVVMPHPDDQHPDHLAVSNFTRLAIVLESQANPGYQPTMMGYLVHYGYFPEPRGYHPDKSLLPPVPLSGTDYQWVRYNLSIQEEKTKVVAVADYSSQIHLMEDFLVSFDRTDEPFMQLSIQIVPALAYTSLPAPVSTGGGFNYFEPSRETSRLLIFPGADLIGWKVSRAGDNLLLTAETRGPLMDGIQYRIIIKAPNGTTHNYLLTDPAEHRSYSSFTTQVSLAELGNPTVLVFSAETTKDVVLDYTAWEFIQLGIPSMVVPTPTQ